LALSGIPPSKKRNIKIIEGSRLRTLRGLIGKKDKTHTYSQDANPVFDFGQQTVGKLVIPLKKRRDNRLLGLIVLGFSSPLNLEAQELEFYDLFSLHAASILIEMEILK
jgi:hypothetical protein